jgi:hypothetical protein
MEIVKYKIVIPVDISPYPESHEISAAAILTEYFKRDITFIKRSRNHTADILVGRMEWEIKSLTGAGKHNIQHKLQEAAKQSKNVVLDARRSKIHQLRFNAEAKHQFEIIRGLKRMVIIEKNKHIIDISR